MIENQKGARLSFSNVIESEIFSSPYLKRPPDFKNLKGIMMFGRDSDVFWKSDANWWRRNAPNVKVIEFPGGHMFPLEQPEETALVINEFLSDKVINIL